MLPNKVHWQKFEKSFSPLYYEDNGRPAKPIHMMVGLILLRHLRNISDESVVEEWQENAYYQYFCGWHEFSINPPCKRYGTGIFSQAYWSGRRKIGSGRKYPN